MSPSKLIAEMFASLSPAHRLRPGFLQRAFAGWIQRRFVTGDHGANVQLFASKLIGG